MNPQIKINKNSSISVSDIKETERNGSIVIITVCYSPLKDHRIVFKDGTIAANEYDLLLRFIAIGEGGTDNIYSIIT